MALRPWTSHCILLVLRNALQQRGLLAENARLRDEVQSRYEIVRPLAEGGFGQVYLAGVGLATSAGWLASRDILGTAVFHNFFAVTGVLGALEGGALAPAAPVIVTALAAAALLAWPAIRWSRGAGHA